MHPFVVLVFLPCDGIKKKRKGERFCNFHVWMISVVSEKLVSCFRDFVMQVIICSSYHDTKSH